MRESQGKGLKRSKSFFRSSKGRNHPFETQKVEIILSKVPFHHNTSVISLMRFLRILVLLVKSVHHQSDRFVGQYCDFFAGPVCAKMKGQALPTGPGCFRRCTLSKPSFSRETSSRLLRILGFSSPRVRHGLSSIFYVRLTFIFLSILNVSVNYFQYW
jgi:hypothetical protein